MSCGHRALIRLSLNNNTFPLRITCVPLKMIPKRKIKLVSFNFLLIFISIMFPRFKSIMLTRKCQERSNYFLLKPEMRKFCTWSKKLIGLWNSDIFHTTLILIRIFFLVRYYTLWHIYWFELIWIWIHNLIYWNS